MFVHNINPVIFSLGPLSLHWYGLAYLVGFFFVVWWLQLWRKKGELELSKDEVWDFCFYMMVSMLIGARVFVAFWQPELYLKDPLEIFRIWNGGMSFHGGLVGILVGGYIYTKWKKISFLHLADICATPAVFALAVGRIANFINAEHWGPLTNVPWCVEFPTVEGCRHPNQLYASAKRFAVFGWLYFLSFSKLRAEFKTGFIFWNFVFWDGLGRFVLDFWREETIHYLGMTPGQMLSAIMVLVAMYFFWKNHQKDWKRLLRLKK